MKYTFIEDKRFKTNYMTIFFDMPYDRDLDLAFKVLANLMSSVSNKYNTKEKMTYIKDYLYGANYRFSYVSSANESTFKFTISFLNPIYTNYKTSEVFDFIKEVLLHPLFDEKYIKEILDILKDKIDRSLDKPLNYAQNRVYQILDDTPLAKLDIDFKDKIDEFDISKVKVAYDRLFNASIKAYVNGDFNKEDLDQFFDSFDYDDNDFKYVSLKTNIEDRGLVIEDRDLSQSCFIEVFENDYLYDDDNYYHLLVSDAMLGNIPNSLLFNNAREKNGLCYSIYTRLYKNLGITSIVSMISYQKYKKLLEVIDECIDTLINQKYEPSFLEDAKNYLINSLESIEDDPSSIINFVHNQNMSSKKLSLEMMFEKIKEVSMDDVSNVMKTYRSKMIYILRGTQDERA